MASRTFGNFKRGSVTIMDYHNWRDSGDARPACANTTNDAFTNARASESDIQAAKATCAKCPLLKGCDFFANTKHFRDFDGVMGGTLYERSMDDDVEVFEEILELV